MKASCAGLCSALETGVPALAKGVHSRTWLERPLVSDDGSRPEQRHLVSEEHKPDRAEEMLGLFFHQQEPLLSTVRISPIHCMH